MSGAVAERPIRTEWTGPYRSAVALDRELGDPRKTDNPYGFPAMVDRDAREAYPEALATRVGPLLRNPFVGSSTMDEVLMLVRMAGRRDVTVMPATMFSITAASCVLLSGSQEQKDRVLSLMGEGGSVGFALSEAEHGSDLLANQCAAQRMDDGSFLLHGEKWLVGTGQRCEALLLVARTGGRGPAAFSSLLVDADALRTARIGTPQRPTGMRGIDFGGFRFEGVQVPESTLVGEVGHGLETAMKAMQLVRATSTAANLACADTGLRMTLDFAAEHVVAGKILGEHPQARRDLGTAFTALLAGDVVALSAARALHTLPGAHSLWSSVSKKVLTELSDEVFDRCADVLGTRSLLRDGRFAAFDVARRDNAVVRHIDTGPVANTRLVAMQLGQLAVSQASPDGCLPSYELGAGFALDAVLPPLNLSGLELSNRGRDEVTATLPMTVASALAFLDGIPEDDHAVRATKGMLRVEAGISLLWQDVLKLLHESGSVANVELFDLAERFCYLHAAASCVHLWWFNRHLPLAGLRPGDTSWLWPVLELLLDRAHGRNRRLPGIAVDSCMALASRLHTNGRLFSLVPLPLAESVDVTPGEGITTWPA